MASNYPGSLDAWADKSASDTLAAAGHTAHHNDVADAVEELEAKVGTGSSPAASATTGQVLTADGAGGTAWESATYATVLVDYSGVTDAAPAINAAIAALPTAGGDLWLLPSGAVPSNPTVKIGSTITIGNGGAGVVSTRQGVTLRAPGGGAGWGEVMLPTSNNPYGGLRLLWSGGASPMVTIAGPLQGWGLKNLTLDGNGVATGGIFNTSGMNGFNENLYIRGTVQYGLRETTVSAFGGSTPNAMHNHFNGLTVAVPDINGFKGVWLEGVGTTNTCFEHFYDTMFLITPPTGGNVTNGIYLTWVDSINFDGLHFNNQPSNFYAVTFDYSVAANLPGSNHFHRVELGGGGAANMRNIGTPNASGFTKPNFVHTLDVANGTTTTDPRVPNLVWNTSSSRLTETVKTVPYSLTSADARNAMVTVNAATTTYVSVYTDAVTPGIPAGSRVQLHQYGAGRIVVSPEAGVTLRSHSNYRATAGQYARAELWKRANDEWVLSGNLASFTPTDIPGLVYWFNETSSVWQDSARTTAAVADGDPVGAWDDASGAGVHAVQATAGLRPLLKLGANGINSKRVIRFDGTDDKLVSPGATATKPFTLFVVHKPTSFASARAIVGGAAGGMSLGIDTSGKQQLIKAGVAVIATSTSALSAATAAIVAVTYNGVGGWEFFRNRASDGTGQNNQTFTAGSTEIGSNSGSGTFYLGDIAEVIKYDAALTLSEMRAIHDYLGIKYGITLA